MSMTVSFLNAYVQIKNSIKSITDDRIVDGLPEEFITAKEAMLLLHCEWQDLMSAVKTHDIEHHAALAALKLAAAAIKFATDLGDPVAMKLIEQVKDEVSDDTDLGNGNVRSRDKKLLRLSTETDDDISKAGINDRRVSKLSKLRFKRSFNKDRGKPGSV